MAGNAEIGKIGWIDITVDDAGSLRDFYAKVVGWEPEEVSMGEYSHFNMTMPGSGEPAAGIYHARGGNTELPSQWLIYIVVGDAAESARTCTDNGGKVIVQPKPMGGGSFCVIEDPGGAVAGIVAAAIRIECVDDKKNSAKQIRIAGLARRSSRNYFVDESR